MSELDKLQKMIAAQLALDKLGYTRILSVENQTKGLLYRKADKLFWLNEKTMGELKMGYLAIGIAWEDGSTWSINTGERTPQKVADALAEHNGNGSPDEILLIQNDMVEEHWNLGKHYEESSS